jgi:hypothetical protein
MMDDEVDKFQFQDDVQDGRGNQSCDLDVHHTKPGIR